MINNLVSITCFYSLYASYFTVSYLFLITYGYAIMSK